MTMKWTYAITKESLNGEDSFSIREVYFDTESPEKLSWTEDAIAPRGETPEEVIQDLVMMLGKAKDGEILDITLDPPKFTEYPVVSERSQSETDTVG